MTFHEEITSDFQKMLDYRKAVGYATDTYKSMIMPFIDYCVKNYSDTVAIPQEMVDSWLEKYGYIHVSDSILNLLIFSEKMHLFQMMTTR